MPTDAFVFESVDELSLMKLPSVWRQMPPDMLEDYGFWMIVKSMVEQMKRDHVVPLGPPTNIGWTLVSSAEEVDAIELRHPCDDCRETKILARTAVAEFNETMVFVQFTQRYMRRVGFTPSEFRAQA